MEPRPVVRWTGVEKALKCAPHSFGVAEPALFSDGFDRQESLFEPIARCVSPRPFCAFRRSQSRLAVKEPRKVARTYRHAIRQSGHAQISFGVRQHPGLKLAEVWPHRFLERTSMASELGLPARTLWINNQGSRDAEHNFWAEIFLH